MPTQVVHLSPGIIAHSSSLCVRCRVSDQVALDVRLSECRCDMLSTSRAGRNVRAVICCVCVCLCTRCPSNWNIQRTWIL